MGIATRSNDSRVLPFSAIYARILAAANNIRTFVTKRKISGGTVSHNGRDARDIMLGLAKTCMKLKLSFYEFLGAPCAPTNDFNHLSRAASGTV